MIHFSSDENSAENRCSAARPKKFKRQKFNGFSNFKFEESQQIVNSVTTTEGNNDTESLARRENIEKMALKSDAFFQKAITSLARALAHINPTPEDKVSLGFGWNFDCKKIIDLVSLKNYFAVPTTIPILSPRELGWSVLHRFAGT